TRQNAFAHVTLLPPPRVPWQITGNHWIALPCIHPADGSVHALGVLHRGSRSAIELAASADFLSGTGVPLLKPTIRVGESSRDFAGAPMISRCAASLGSSRARESTSPSTSRSVRSATVPRPPCGCCVAVVGASSSRRRGTPSSLYNRRRRTRRWIVL